MNNVKTEETYSTFIEDVRSKRARCSNFTPQEKNVLIHIVEKFEVIVESKKTDKQSILKKERAWDTITDEFNEILGPEMLRTAKQLKMCYENLKRRLKKQGLDEKFNQSGESRPVSSQNIVSSDRRQDSDVESNSSTDTIRPLVEESCGKGFFYRLGAHLKERFTIQNNVSVPGDKVNGSSTEVHLPSSEADEATGPPEPVELPEGPVALAKLRQMLLKKEIALANLDLEMRAKKYELELRVQEAKLEYYRRKTALLARMPNGDS